MAEWRPPSDDVLGVGKPATPGPVRAIRDLTTALARRAAGAPYLNAVGDVAVLTGFEPLLTGTATFGGERSLTGTWMVPDGVYRLDVTLVGGGGAGGNGAYLSAAEYHALLGREDPGHDYHIRTIGSGGGAGAMVRQVLEVSPGMVIPVTIGAGGSSGRVHPSVDPDILGFWNVGDGAPTVFGDIGAAGGMRGWPINHGYDLDVTGAGGGEIDGRLPTIRGANGERSVAELSGDGAGTLFGGGAPGRSIEADGYDAYRHSDDGPCGVPGAGGGGAGLVSVNGPNLKGGRGANGIVIVRF